MKDVSYVKKIEAAACWRCRAELSLAAALEEGWDPFLVILAL